jgi:hypothetical protein
LFPPRFARSLARFARSPASLAQAPHLFDARLADALRKCDVVVLTAGCLDRPNNLVTSALSGGNHGGGQLVGGVAVAGATGAIVATAIPSAGLALVNNGPAQSVRAGGHSPRIVFALPPAPTIAEVLTQLLVVPAVSAMRGLPKDLCRPLSATCTLSGPSIPANSGKLLSYHAVRVSYAENKLVCASTGLQGAFDLR